MGCHPGCRSARYRRMRHVPSVGLCNSQVRPFSTIVNLKLVEVQTLTVRLVQHSDNIMILALRSMVIEFGMLMLIAVFWCVSFCRSRAFAIRDSRPLVIPQLPRLPLRALDPVAKVHQHRHRLVVDARHLVRPRCLGLQPGDDVPPRLRACGDGHVRLLEQHVDLDRPRCDP